MTNHDAIDPAAGELAALSADLVALRRELHQDPELDRHLPRTQGRILEALSGLDLEIATGRSLSSVTAVLRGGRPGPAVLLRADMDALPVQENTGLDFASRNGAMHACGHDLHMTGLVGAARLLAARRDELAGDVVLMFQPAEETAGGAERMIEEGVLTAAGAEVVAAYGLHVFSSVIPGGLVVTKPGPMLASADCAEVEFVGAGGHGSMPHAAKDPVVALCEAVLALQTMVTREFDVFDPVVLTVGQIAAGTAPNVIPDSARFAASIRSFTPQTRRRLGELVERTVRGVAEAHGLAARVNYQFQYPVTANDPGHAAFALDTARDLFGPGAAFEMPRPVTGSEDFSFVLDRVPGAFVGLGACPPDRDPATASANHAGDAVFDEAVLPQAAVLLAELATRRLALAAG